MKIPFIDLKQAKSKVLSMEVSALSQTKTLSDLTHQQIRAKVGQEAKCPSFQPKPLAPRNCRLGFMLVLCIITDSSSAKNAFPP